jgi:hypothetical protein
MIAGIKEGMARRPRRAVERKMDSRIKKNSERLIRVQGFGGLI